MRWGVLESVNAFVDATRLSVTSLLCTQHGPMVRPWKPQSTCSPADPD
jgi:hypothetical protein